MVQIIGWTLVHSFWQIGLIAILYWLSKISLKGRSANVLYWLAYAAISACLLTVIGTFAYIYFENLPIITSINSNQISDSIAPITSTILTSIDGFFAINLKTYLTFLFPYLVAFWAIGMLVFAIRFIVGLQKIRLIQNVESELISEFWQTKIKEYQHHLSIEKSVSVFLSKNVREPLTFGHFKPVVLLPIGLMTGLSTTAIETILIHELAHIKRHDYLMNLLQSVIEIILFYHPIIWWLSKEIRVNREHCCDDIVVAVSGNRDVYVETLTTLQWQKLKGGTPALAMGANGDTRDFSKRIKRMFGVEETITGNNRWWIIGILCFLIGGATIYQEKWNKWLAKNETGVDYPNYTYNFLIHKNTNFNDISTMFDELKVLGVKGAFKTSKNTTFCEGSTPEITYPIKGFYCRERGDTIFINIKNRAQTVLKLSFDKGFLNEPELIDLSNAESYNRFPELKTISNEEDYEQGLRDFQNFIKTISDQDSIKKGALGSTIHEQREALINTDELEEFTSSKDIRNYFDEVRPVTPMEVSTPPRETITKEEPQTIGKLFDGNFFNKGEKVMPIEQPKKYVFYNGFLKNRVAVDSILKNDASGIAPGSLKLFNGQPKFLLNNELEEQPKAILVGRTEPEIEGFDSVNNISIPKKIIKKDTLPNSKVFELKSMPTFDTTSVEEISILDKKPSLSSFSKIIFIVDGIVWDEDDVKKIKSEEVLTIDVKKGMSAKMLYGGEQVVIITTKKRANNKKQ